MKYILILLLLLNVGCQKRDNSDKIQNKKTEQILNQAAKAVDIPNIRNFTEKRFAKMIYELRDKEVKTFSYFMDMTGGLHFLCESVGYGLPASVQYVSPEKRGYWREMPNLPQAEPNGLFMPDSLDATYVLCMDEKGKIKPVYSEPKLIVSPFRLKAKTNLK